MILKPGDVIKHKAFMDVAIQIFFISKDPDTASLFVQGMWMNQGQVESYELGYPAEFYIKFEHVQNWLKCKKPNSKFIRNEEWVPI